MKANKHPYPTGEDLIALRAVEDPVRFICERLRVEAMGPADYILTKHEVRDFLRAGGTGRAEADAIVQRAQLRLAEEAERVRMRQSQQNRFRPSE